jgi:hypothetical protein
MHKKWGFKPPWIGIDYDGTLVKSHTWQGYDYTGEPIWPMIRRVRKWLRQGRVVKIFSSRAEAGPKAIKIIQDWCEKMGLGRLEVTNVKDSGLVEIWDDLAVRVIENKGTTCCKYRGNWKSRALYGN